MAMAFFSCTHTDQTPAKDFVDYVNPYIGNISHLLVPTYPTVHLPNSMLRVYPERGDYTSDRVNGLPVVVTSHCLLYTSIKANIWQSLLADTTVLIDMLRAADGHSFRPLP